ncbi:hypothetical protein C8J56DRAFT_872070 [Mycena floridula]|nr:hypothetical protein C8J56DRAFT_872070 [Mycena floridula]
MGEVVNVIVAFAVIVFIFRWMTSGNDGERNQADILGFRPKTVSPTMLETVSTMFPDIPQENIRYDLLRTGSVERTTNKILEKGFLDAPPNAYYTLFPRDPNTPSSNAPGPAGATAATGKSQPAQETLISRYKLKDRVASSSEPISEEEIGGKAVWESTAAQREASLKERKAKMVLAARQRLLAMQEKKADS